MKPNAQGLGEAREVSDGLGRLFRTDLLQQSVGFSLHKERIFRRLDELRPLPGRVGDKGLGL